MCYRVGAHKSSIVASWIAVCYDLMDKLKELAIAGDQQAEGVIESIRKARSQNDLGGLLKHERDLLELARDKFEFVSHLEFVDLNRLREDRNRCAHPSLALDEEAFNPSGELARLHIRSAVIHLLQHPPVQGKYALDRLLNEVDSEYFPQNEGDAVRYLSSGPLRKPRESLVRNFVVVLLKKVLDPKAERRERRRFFSALAAAKALHLHGFEKTMRETFSAKVRSFVDKDLRCATWFLSKFPESWCYLEADVKCRLDNYVKGLPVDEFDDLGMLLKIPSLVDAAEVRVGRATRRELCEAFIWTCPPQVAARCIDLYIGSISFEQANEMGRLIVSYVPDFIAEHKMRLVVGISSNPQIMGSFELKSVIDSLRKDGNSPLADFENLLIENGLVNYALPQARETIESAEE